MGKMPIPPYVQQVLKLLETNNYKAYIVGGAVRDYLLGAKPHDYDVATDATPEAVCQIAAASKLTVVENLGHNFGVVLLVVEGKPVEVGTFRSEIYGEHAHRPEQVTFCSSLEEDLSRRDFTINAMAADKHGQIIDLYQGRQDLSNKLVCTVGPAPKRFAEDALRMFRACRFCAQLGFMPAPDLLAAISSELGRVQGLSFERVKNEWEKILLAPHVDTGLQLLVRSGLIAQQVSQRADGQNKLVPILPELKTLLQVMESKQEDNYKAWQHMLTALVLSKTELKVRWAILLYDMAKEYYRINKENIVSPFAFSRTDVFAAALARKILTRFRYNEKFIKELEWLLANHTNFIAFLRAEEELVKNWLADQARKKQFANTQVLFASIELLCNICLADIAAQRSDEENLLVFRQLGQRIVGLAAQMPVHTSDLAISGKKVMLFLPPEQVGGFLQDVLRLVQSGQMPNDKTQLLTYLENYPKK